MAFDSLAAIEIVPGARLSQPQRVRQAGGAGKDLNAQTASRRCGWDSRAAGALSKIACGLAALALAAMGACPALGSSLSEPGDAVLPDPQQLSFGETEATFTLDWRV